ncbi:MAG TPA: hypothetical protein VHV83_19670 [Armatimonadota bacterium]|nr:hypothetical protein [Armatimonadota bacterium]
MAEQESAKVFAVGDHIRLKDRVANSYPAYQITDTQVAFSRVPADGLVLSIREISTGRLVTETTENVDKYIIEVLYDNTFNPRYASSRNAPRTAERATATPAWNRIRHILKGMAEKGELMATGSPTFFTDSPLSKLLDGWKVIKVNSVDITNLDAPKAATGTANA